MTDKSGEKSPIGDELRQVLSDDPPAFDLCGAVTNSGRIYPLGSDTKVLSTLFELVARPYIFRVAERHGLQVHEPKSQNVYPDFTLMSDAADEAKIAIDVKTTYRSADGRFNFTLGGYTSFLRNPRKNIEFPYPQYKEHWILGFVYDRIATKKSAAAHSYELESLGQIPVPIANVEWFVQEKWRVASRRAGSGNTRNIGSVNADLSEFQDGRGGFESEEEFLAYWRAYKPR